MKNENNYVCKNCKLNFNLAKNGTVLCPRCYSCKVKKNKKSN